MSNFDYGYWEVTIEKQGRLKLPAALLKSLPEDGRKQFWITHGFGSYLILWTEKSYREQMDFLNSLDRNIEQVKRYRNAFLRNTTFIESDAQDRFVIPKPLMEKHGLEREVVLLLDNGRIEIWNKSLYDSEYDLLPEEFSKLNEAIHTGNYQIAGESDHVS